MLMKEGAGEGEGEREEEGGVEGEEEEAGEGEAEVEERGYEASTWNRRFVSSKRDFLTMADEGTGEGGEETVEGAGI